ncbi:MAG: hypothetical protein ACYDEV_02935 [Acidiferrobacter sp.]
MLAILTQADVGVLVSTRNGLPNTVWGKGMACGLSVLVLRLPLARSASDSHKEVLKDKALEGHDESWRYLLDQSNRQHDGVTAKANGYADPP